MELIRGIQNLQSKHRPSVATIGNFDGVHLGHQAVIKTLMAASTKLQLPATVITFDPLAKEFFAPRAARRLQTLAQRVDLLFDLGVQQVLVIDFNADLAGYSPTKFVKDILRDGLGIQYLSVGDDFRFGENRAGGFDFLQSVGREHGFAVVAHETFKLSGERVSSGRLREAVGNSDFSLAAELLGRPFALAGKVEKGQQRGRTIGFPTANIVLDAARFAVHGVYAVRVILPDTAPKLGVANVGTRPTVGGSENRLEVHLFDFDASLYGEYLRVEFVAKIRDEMKFPSFAELQEQIREDAAQAKKLLVQLTEVAEGH